ncbi:MAG: cupin-like domain-containing protein [Synechococcales bacterium]|nr:cupin-like domain-containing protein [Synechococcales bacterium]
MAADFTSPDLQQAIQSPSSSYFAAYQTQAAPVARVHSSSISSQTFHQRYRNPGIPVVVSGLLDDEPVWSLDYLCQMLGDRVFPVRHYGRDRYQQDKRQWTSSGSGVEARSMAFPDYAQLLKTGVAQEQDLYLARCSIKETPLADRCALQQAESWFNLRFPATSLNLWLGAGGHTSCLHYDPMDGLLMQLNGAKKVLLFPPHQTYNLYPIPVYKQLRYGLKLRSVYSQVYPQRPDLQTFPRFAGAMPHASEVILQQGEILFLPAGWWHEVTSLGDGVVCSINRFWNVLPPARALLSWNKWRAHLGSIFAAPHVVAELLSAACKPNANDEIRKLTQRL